MNEENKIPNETKKEKPNEITKKEEKITIKKSTYNNRYWCIWIALDWIII